MAYNRTGKITKNDGSGEIIDFDYGEDPTKFSDIDLTEGTIFVSLDTEIDITFTRNVFSNTILVSSDDNKIQGSIQLTHLGVNTSSEENNLSTLKDAIKPSDIISASILTPYSDDLVIMSTDSTIKNDNVVIKPKINLSSNTVYYLNLSRDKIKDYLQKEITFELGKGFVTDNSRSLILSSSGLYKGFSTTINDSELSLYFLGLSSTETETQVVLRDKLDENGNLIYLSDGTTQKEVVNVNTEIPNNTNLEQYRENFSKNDEFFLYRDTDTISTYNLNKPLFGKIKNVSSGKIEFYLDYSCYRMNVSYISTQNVTKVTTYNNHYLENNDTILIYDVVSGDFSSGGVYNITKINNNEFTIPVDMSNKRVGNFNYYPVLSLGQNIVNVKNQKVTKKIIKSTQTSILNDSDLKNKIFNVISYSNPDTGQKISPSLGDIQGLYIRSINNGISYVPINDEKQIVEDQFCNNSIIEFSTDDDLIIGHIKANTNPTHNVHPFNTSAPTISSFYPEEGKPTTSKIKIIEISRIDDLAKIQTNVKHGLEIGDNFYLQGTLDTIFTGFFTVSGVIDEYNFNFLISETINENSPVKSLQQLKLLIFNSSLIKTPENLENVDNYIEKITPFQITFSQSMNTSTISVSNSTHLMYANGSNIQLSSEISKTDSTIQLSKTKDNFDSTTLIDFSTISSNTGNAEFTIVPKNLDRSTAYYFRIKNTISDLGGTNLTYNYVTKEPIITGIRATDSENSSTNEPISSPGSSSGIFTDSNGVQYPIYDLDTTPPRVKKIYFTSNYSNSVLSGVVLDSLTISQITDPIEYKEVETDLNGESIVVVFDESIDPTTVVVNTESTRPTGTIQLSSDDFNTVVQMTDLAVSTTINESDTFSFRPLTNLSSLSTYKLKITKFVGDNAVNKNYLESDNITNIRSLILDSIPDIPNYYEPGETIRGTRTLFVKSSLNLPSNVFKIDGLKTGKIFYGLNSQARGLVYKYTLNDEGELYTIDYTPLETGRYIFDFKPGEICHFEEDDNYRFSINYTAITSSAEGTVIKFLPLEKRIIYRELTPLYEFNKKDDRIYGYKNLGIGKTKNPSELISAGFTTRDDPNDVLFYMENNLNQLFSNETGNVEDISPTTKFYLKFSQPMDTDTFSFNTLDKSVKTEHNIIVSYDSSFSNCIPLEPIYDKSDSDTYFVFTPKIVNEGFQLSQNSDIYFTVRDTVKTQGDTKIYNKFYLEIDQSAIEGNNTGKFLLEDDNFFKLEYKTEQYHMLTEKNEFLITQDDYYIVNEESSDQISNISAGTVGFPFKFKILDQNNFSILHVYIYDENLNRIELLEYDSNVDNSLNNISETSFIEIVFNETVLASSLTIGENNSFELSTDSTFQTTESFKNGVIHLSDFHKNRAVFIPSSSYINLTDYYLRINTSIENPYGINLNKTYTFAKFTIQ